MKKQIFLSVLLALMIGFGQSATAQKISKAQQKEALAVKVKALIESRDYTVSARTALPFGMRSVSLTSDYSLRIKGDSVFSFLPYFGRAYTLPYGGGEGLIFTGIAHDYKLAYGKKQTGMISFTVRTKEDFYTFSLTVASSGSAFIDVFSNNKQSITFNGEIEVP